MPNIEEDERVRASVYLSGRILSDEDKVTLNTIKGLEEEFLRCISQIEKRRGTGSRYLALARTHIENGVLWLVKDVAGI